MNTDRWKKILFICIICIGFFVRLYKLGQVPISLHGDEIGVGYNAYALLTAGIDEYGKPWPLVLRADVAPIIFYATIPSIALFGPTNFAVRFPSVVIGTATIVGIYFLAMQLFKKKSIAFTSMLLMTFSPWHIQMSRIAHDASYALLLQTIATTILLYGAKMRNHVLYCISFFLYGLSFYAYHSSRLTTPLLIMGILFVFREKIFPMRKTVIISLLIFFLTISPIVFDFFSKPIAQTRFGGISIFTRADTSIPFDIRYGIHTSILFFKNYLNQFNPRFLFFDTSSMRYFNVSSVGLFYIWSIPFLLFGLYQLRKLDKASQLLLMWILISILPGALTKGDPNGGRIFMLLVGFIIVTSNGFIMLLSTIQSNIKKNTATVVSCIFLFANIGFFLYQYFIQSPRTFLHQWQYGFSQMAQLVNSQENEFDHIIISNQLRQAYIYILFYGQKDPVWLAQLPNKERHDFIGYTKFGKYEFRPIDWRKDTTLPKTLIVTLPEELSEEHNPTSIIIAPSGNPAILFIDTRSI